VGAELLNMRQLSLLLLAVALSLNAVPVSATGQAPQSFSLSLALPLGSVTVQNGQVTYVWFVPKGPPGPAAQDLTSYDKHVVRTSLTPAGRAWLSAWTRRYHVFSFARRYMPTEPRSYGTVFVTRLTVQERGHTMQSTWDGTSRAKRPLAATAALKAWAQQATSSPQLNRQSANDHALPSDYRPMGLREGDAVVTVRPTGGRFSDDTLHHRHQVSLRRGQRLTVRGFVKGGELVVFVPNVPGRVWVRLADVAPERHNTSTHGKYRGVK